MTTNSPARDAGMALAKTVGTNFKTLRTNKRTLARNLVSAVVTEGFGWRDVWADAKKAMGFAKLEKPEQNQINVYGNALKTIILAWPTLEATVKAAFLNPDDKAGIVYSTLATTIKDADKAQDKADADASATSASEEPASDANRSADDTPVVEADRSAMIDTVAALFDGEQAFTDDEIAAMVRLVSAVNAFSAAQVKVAANG